MCGIYGQIFERPATSESGLSIHHRGPDDAGEKVFFVKDSGRVVSLVFRRLSIIDLSPAGHQPMANEDGTVWVIFNGEIYNFRQLREELIAAGHRFQSKTDTETIVHGYEQWGDGVISRLHGMFALAIWDSSKRRLLLARDRIGKKPLFYAHQGSNFFFGSEIKAILASGEIEVRPDAESLHDYLTYLYFPSPRTAFQGIHKLPPATMLSVEILTDGSLKTEQKAFWDVLEGAANIRLNSRRQAVEEIRRLIDEAVQARLISDVPLGVLLSGGLDSGAITAFAARASGEPVSTFTVGFRDSKFYDESTAAAEISRHCQSDHRMLTVEARCADHMATVVRHFDEPFGNPTAILEYLITKRMRENVTVALSGDGGDEAFGGYVRYLGASMAEKYRKLPSPLTRSLARLSHLLRDDTQGRHGYRRVREFLESAWLPQQEMYLQWVGYFSEAEKSSLYTEEFARQTASRDSGDFLRELFRRGSALDPLARLGYVDIASFLSGNCLEYADRMSMANSLEIRCPFADHRIQELGLAIPFSWKCPRGETKAILREALQGILPASIVTRKKMGFNAPVPQWINHELQPMISELLSRASVNRRGIFRAEGVELLLEDHWQGKRDNALKLWGLLMLELWFRLYIDKKWEPNYEPEACHDDSVLK